ncbi:hypothetical protein F3Y22_tig00000340pilonHSYRG00700 [Hibiscus syriacus]|uniref:Uncharacterized protein n=1 Tax=Hibiscus syriacus TaxID=106335 RepID=A0A6A3D4K4_HIBSY|nr:hypothetical protein F3Y22_tig00000340pilonHSYRG00700 [Hibiscus syriacus]
MQGEGDVPVASLQTLDNNTIASKDNAVQVHSSLEKDKHTVVQVVVNNENRVTREQELRMSQRTAKVSSRKVANKGLSTVQGLTRKGLKAREKDDRAPSKSILMEWLSSMNAELNHAQKLCDPPIHGNPRSTSQMEETVQWRENNTFEQFAQDDVQV